jgi:hypothetical protein
MSMTFYAELHDQRAAGDRPAAGVRDDGASSGTAVVAMETAGPAARSAP